MYLITEFVKSRDKAIVSYWENGELDTLLKHIKKYDGNDLYKHFVNSNQIVQLMTVCKLTLDIASPEVVKYHSQAQELLEELRLLEEFKKRLFEELKKGENNLS